MEHLHVAPQGISRAVELAERAASLDLLHVIDSTVDSLLLDSRFIDGAARELGEVAALIRAEPIKTGQFIDPDDRSINVFYRAEETLKAVFPRMVLKRESIDRDAALGASHRQDLHDAYETWMVSAASMLEALEEVRHCIIAHDLDAEDLSKLHRYANVDDLIAALHK